MNVEQIRKKFFPIFKIPLLFLCVFLIGYFLSNFSYFHWVRIYDYTVCDGIYVWDSEEKEGAFYLYYPYRAPTSISVKFGAPFLIWARQNDTYENVFNDYKFQFMSTAESVMRSDLLARFSDPELVDALMTHEYMTELVMSAGYIGENDEEFIALLPVLAIDPDSSSSGPPYDISERVSIELIPVPGKEHLSYALCKATGRINWLRLHEQPPDINYFTQ